MCSNVLPIMKYTCICLSLAGLNCESHGWICILGAKLVMFVYLLFYWSVSHNYLPMRSDPEYPLHSWAEYFYPPNLGYLPLIHRVLSIIRLWDPRYSWVPIAPTGWIFQSLLSAKSEISPLSFTSPPNYSSMRSYVLMGTRCTQGPNISIIAFLPNLGYLLYHSSGPPNY